MLTLASMVMAAYGFLWNYTHIKYTPQPVVIEVGSKYDYNIYENAIYVPSAWNDSCANQTEVVYMMAIHFNAFKNEKHKMTPETMQYIANKWECLQ